MKVIVNGVSIGKAHLAKIAGAHGIAGNGSISCAQTGLAQAVVVKKEEGLILENGAANSATVVVPAQWWNRIAIAVRKPVVGIEAAIAKELIYAPVKLIRTRAPDHIYHGAPRKPVFRTEIRLLNFKFFNSFG